MVPVPGIWPGAGGKLEGFLVGFFRFCRDVGFVSPPPFWGPRLKKGAQFFGVMWARTSGRFRNMTRITWRKPGGRCSKGPEQIRMFPRLLKSCDA
jgi:hypothetical protein